MNFDPQKFFIGLMDFFSILLPGALLTWLLMGEVGPVVLGNRYAQLAGAQAWAAFLFASYLFGHLVFLLGSWLDEFYDWARGYTLNVQIRRLALRGKLMPWPLRLGNWAVFRTESDQAVLRAEQVKRHLLSPLQAHRAVRISQWCKELLNVETPGSLETRTTLRPLHRSSATFKLAFTSDRFRLSVNHFLIFGSSLACHSFI